MALKQECVCFTEMWAEYLAGTAKLLGCMPSYFLGTETLWLLQLPFSEFLERKEFVPFGKEELTFYVKCEVH